MPLPKYYCDYCEKQFQDTASARKRHLQGIQHQRAKAQWYDSFQIYESDRRVCNHFVRTGSCQYGDSCKYFHPNLNTHIRPVDLIRDGTGVSLGNLPPSLRPPPEGGCPPLPFVDWG